ncbi:MAG TPA: STAS domain-containing protein [Anaerolineae bacterium]|nr:STAS domain-containing protein [Anaerolineae bacterium]
MEVTISQAQGRVPVTVMCPHGDLDASNYRDLIAAAQEVIGGGGQYIVLDLSDTPYLSSSGLVALQSIAAMLRGEDPADLESGWSALRMVDRDRETGLQQNLRIVNPQPRVEKVFDMVGFKRFLAIDSDLDTAVASF